MNFDEKDEQFRKEIKSLLWQRHRINANQMAGSMPMQPEWEDQVSPEITITEQAIKETTGRDKIRGVVMDKYEKELKTPGVQVTRVDDKTLKVSIAPMRKSENEFFSIKALRAANEEDLKEDASLDDSPYS